MDAIDIIKMIPGRTQHDGVFDTGKCYDDCLKCVASEWLENYAVPEKSTFKHCDDYIHDLRAPDCLRFFLLVHRLPAVDGALLSMNGVKPRLFADYKLDNGKRVRVVMASRFGDVGITSHLDAEVGYENRVSVDTLTNFGPEP